MDKFWMVYNVSRGALPTKKHEYKSDATAEAERLAKVQPGDEFVILEATDSCKVPDPVKWEALRDPVPF